MSSDRRVTTITSRLLIATLILIAGPLSATTPIRIRAASENVGRVPEPPKRPATAGKHPQYLTPQQTKSAPLVTPDSDRAPVSLVPPPSTRQAGQSSLQELREREREAMRRVEQQARDLIMRRQLLRDSLVPQEPVPKIPQETGPDSTGTEPRPRTGDLTTEEPDLPPEAATIPRMLDKPVRSSAEDPVGEGDATTLDEPNTFSVVEGPIDRLALAGSLLATGQHFACQQVLDAVDVEGLSPSQRSWFEYLRASIARQQGDVSEAENLYRGVLDQPGENWIGEVAKWWLDHLDEQRRITADLSQLDDTLKQWRTEIDALRAAD